MLSIACTSLLTTACAPLYQPQDITKTVTIHSEADTHLRICKNNEWYRLKKDRSNLVKVPYGRRISIGNNYYQSQTYGNIIESVSCFPQISFIPKQGNRYYLNFYIHEKTCKLEILRYSNKNKTGFAAEESVSKELACLP